MKRYFVYLIGLSLLLSSVSCTKNFDKMNTDPGSLTEAGKLELGYMFTRAESAACMNQGYYQTVQNLSADLYAQYFALNTTSFQTDRYVINDLWLPRLGIVTDVFTAPQLKTIFENTDSTSGEAALANIIWVFAFHRMTDYFGPIPYFKVGEPEESIPYDSQEDIYMDLLKRLENASNILENTDEDNIFGSFDIIYDGDPEKWLHFANTLRLRLAMRISNVKPDVAKEAAEAAVKSGVMTSKDQSAWITKSIDGGDGNGLSNISSFHEFSMSSTIASYLKGYEDPRMSTYFQPIIGGTDYKSIRNGTPASDLNDPMNSASNTSNVGAHWVAWSGSNWRPDLTADQPVLYAAEAYFLRAEGALNGWDMDGTPEELYEKGIETSMQEWGINDQGVIDQYLQSGNLPAAPEDFENSPPVSTDVSIKWSTDETSQRAQIGTQKWLALYPDGFEGWAEFRRTGYPEMYPVVKSDNADLPAGTFIQRLPYPSTEAANNKEELDKGIELLGGPDKVSTKLWWAK